jgi:hypothetical protein
MEGNITVSSKEFQRISAPKAAGPPYGLSHDRDEKDPRHDRPGVPG